MAGDIGKIRIRVPSNAKAGDVVRVRCLVIHPMERIERDAQGKIIDRNYNYITRVTATYLGKPVVAFDLTQSVSENPAFTFALKAAAPSATRAGPRRITAPPVRTPTPTRGPSRPCSGSRCPRGSPATRRKAARSS